MIDREHDLPVTKQAKFCASAVAAFICPRASVSATDLEVVGVSTGSS